MQQIADWLEKLGLGQRAQRFAENDVDFDLLADRREPFAKIALFCCEALQRAVMPALPPWLDPPCRQPQDEPGAELVAKMRRCGISGDRYRNPPDREHLLDERFIGRKVRDAFVPGSRYTRPLIRPGLNRISVERVLIGSGAAPRTRSSTPELI